MWVFIAKRSAGGKERPLIPAGGRQVVHGHKGRGQVQNAGAKGQILSFLPSLPWRRGWNHGIFQSGKALWDYPVQSSTQNCQGPTFGTLGATPPSGRPRSWAELRSSSKEWGQGFWDFQALFLLFISTPREAKCQQGRVAFLFYVR